MKGHEVVIQGDYKLSGSLTLPSSSEEKYPLLVMVHGSGDLDRDENTKQLRINAFKEFSELAVELGFATLRYDKRGVGKSEGDFHRTGLQDLISDGVAAVQFGKRHQSIDENKVIVLGHSEGSMIAPAIYKQVNVQGLILIAGTAEPLAVTMEWQRAQLKEDLLTLKGFQGWLIRLLKVDKQIDKNNQKLMSLVNQTEDDVIKFKGKKINAKWDREHQAYNVKDILPLVTCPVLAVTGTKDVQVKPHQIHDIANLVAGDCETHLVEDLTHMLRKTDKENRFTAILKDYKKQVKKPVD